MRRYEAFDNKVTQIIYRMGLKKKVVKLQVYDTMYELSTALDIQPVEVKVQQVQQTLFPRKTVCCIYRHF